jgi:flagellin
LAGIDVSTSGGATSGLAAIEALIDTAIDAAASFGSAQGRIETQSDFVSKLSDSLKTGIGSMVDADMEEVSARLQALQTQQQLGVQSLSIANQAPQTILSLFR